MIKVELETVMRSTIYSTAKVSYQKGGYWSKSQGFVTTKISIRKEGSKQGTKIASAIEDVDSVSCWDSLQMENTSKVNQEVRWGAKRSQLLKCLVPCKILVTIFPGLEMTLFKFLEKQ